MYNYFFYQEYKKHMGKPRVVIYGVDYFLFKITSERHWMRRFDEFQVAADDFQAESPCCWPTSPAWTNSSTPFSTISKMTSPAS